MSKQVDGAVLHDDPDSGNPIKVGGIAKDIDGTDPGSVVENDRVNAAFSRNGQMLVSQVHPWSFHTFTSYAAGQTAGAAQVASPGAGLCLHIQDIIVYSDTAATFNFSQDPAGTPANKFVLTLPTGGGDKSRTFNPPIRLTAAKAFGFISSTTVTSAYIAGFIAP